jgi:signal transduction histidine kinase
MGVLYLENNLATRAFTPERLRLLLTLSSQIATSLQNSLLFEKLNQAIRLRDEFMSVASHELNTPIASLRLVSQSFERMEGPPAAAEFSKLVNIISRQTHRLAALVGDILDVGQIPAGNFTLRREPVELAALVRETVELARGEIERTRTRLVIRADEQLVGQWDRARIQKVIGNLLSNALKFAPGKDVEVTVGSAGPGWARLTVEDHGIGIAPERLPHIFGRFERAVSALHYGGLGLGLYIVRAVVEAHGGSVTVTSAPGEGAKFTVELPMRVGDRTPSLSEGAGGP